jgi:hypothetical protein
VVTQVADDVKLSAIGGETHTVEEWLTTFQLLTVVLDPYTPESGWLFKAATKILSHFQGADCRVAWTITADEADTRRFLGPWAEEFLTFADPKREFVAALGIERLPALVYVRQDLAVIGQAEGWDPAEWEHILQLVAKVNSWSYPQLGVSGEPGPYAGSPAKG